jgi:hypothetical protein
MDSPEVVPSPPPEATVHTLFEPSTGTYQWLVACPVTKQAVVIDPVLDGRTPSASGISTTAADKILDLVRNYRYTVIRILETHSHGMATAAWYLRGQLNQMTGYMPRICTGKSIAGVQRMFQRQYRIQNAFQTSRFDAGFKDSEIFEIGKLNCQVLLLSKPRLETEKFGFVVGQNVFSGTVEGASVEPTSRRLSVLHDGHFFHPHGSRPGTPAAFTDVESRPTSSRTELSTWQHSPTELRRPSAERRLMHSYSRPHSQIHEIGV